MFKTHHLLSVALLASSVTHVAHAKIERNKEEKTITFTNNTGHYLRIVVQPVEISFESPKNSGSRTSKHRFKLNDSTTPQTIKLIRYEIGFARPNQETFKRIIDMFVATECIVQLLDGRTVVTETTLDITNFQSGISYQVNYTNDTLTVTSS